MSVGPWIIIIFIFGAVAWLMTPKPTEDPRGAIIPPGPIALAMAQYHSAALATAGATPPNGTITLAPGAADTAQTFSGFTACSDGKAVATYESTPHGAFAGSIVAALVQYPIISFGVAKANALTDRTGATAPLPCPIADGRPVILTRVLP